MDRNTILAIVLSAIVIIAGSFVQMTFFPPEPATQETVSQIEEPVQIDENNPISANVDPSTVLVPIGDNPSAEPFVIENEVVEITFEPEGGTISSVKLKEHLSDGKASEFIFKDSWDTNPYMLYVGADKNNAINAVFSHSETQTADGSITQVTFSRDFQTDDGREMRIEKIFAVPNTDEYAIQLAVRITSLDGSLLSIGSNDSLYSIAFGPQVGPEFESISSNYDYRMVYELRRSGGNKHGIRYSDGLYVADHDLSWMALTGKYFVYIGGPTEEGIIRSFEATNETFESGVTQKNYLYMVRNATDSSAVTDVYTFYMGPQNKGDLSRYDVKGNNSFGLEDQGYTKVMDTGWLTWLENILKWCLNILYKIIPNYGVAIILLTIIIKILLHPLSKRSQESTAKMGALSPRIEEIRNKYPDNPEAQNAAMAKLYKEEGINPMGSCLPMLIQFPILIAFYGLLNKNIELRGAMFIPGWINDLSIPETIFTLPFNIPFLGNQVHLLPILYTFSMIFSMKITQSSSSVASGQQGMMKFMTYGMPIIFFFILYNAPSGLLLYWSVMNVITIGTQIYVNKKKGSVYKKEEEEKERSLREKKARSKRNKRK